MYKRQSELRATYPPYFIAKNRVDLTPEIDVDAILAKVKEIYKNEEDVYKRQGVYAGSPDDRSDYVFFTPVADFCSDGGKMCIRDRRYMGRR